MQAETLDAIEAVKSAVDLLRKHVGWDSALAEPLHLRHRYLHLIFGTVKKMHSE